MALLNKLSAAGELGGSILKKMFTGLFEGDKKRTVTSSRTAEPLKEGATEMEAFAHAVRETNQILNESIDLQKTQNITLNQILELLKDYKPGNDKGGFNLSDLFDFSSKDKPNTKPNNKPNVTGKNKFNPRGLKLGVVGILGGVALDYAGEQLADSGHEKLAAGTDIASSALSGAGTGAMLGSFVPVIGTGIGAAIGGAIGGAYGLYQNWGDLFGGEDKPKQNANTKTEGDIKETAAQILKFDARDITFTAKDMLIRADEIKINGQVQQTSIPAGNTPAVAPSVTTPSVLGTQPTPPGQSPSTGGASPPASGGPGTGNLSGFNVQSGVDTRVSQGIVDKLRSLQSSIPGMTITSGYRDPARNARVGGAKGSQHLQGNAVDVKFPADVQGTLKAIADASAAGVGGIGVYGPGKLHFDTGPKRSWGPDYHASSIPQWALEATQAHTGIKKYAGGSDYVPETGPAIVGEKGPELVIGKDGSTRMTGSGAHVENLRQGDSVLPADKTKKLAGYADGTKKANKSTDKIIAQPNIESSSNPISSFFTELTSPLTGKTTDDRKFIENTTREVMQGNVSGDTVGKFGARVVKGFSPVGLDNAGNAVRAAAKGDISEAAGQAVRSLPFGGFVADTVNKITGNDMEGSVVPPPPPPPIDKPKPPTASANPPPMPMRRPSEFNNIETSSIPAGMGPASGDLLKAYLTSGQ